MRRLLIGMSSKMNLTSTETRRYLRALVPLVSDLTDRDLFVLPPFTSLWVAKEELAGTAIAWGAQDVHASLSGPHTGDISAPMLVDLGCRYVEVGHPERRREHGETDPRIAGKVEAALTCGLEVLLSVGERGRTTPSIARGIVLRHLAAVLRRLPPEALDRVVVAYEPGWAIGAGASAAPVADITAMHEAVAAWFSRRGARQTRVIYGGSVDPKASAELVGQPSVAGLFVGRAALDPVEFARIAHAGLEASGQQR